MTAVLDLDIGNTRAKWRCDGAGGALASPQLPTLQRLALDCRHEPHLVLDGLAVALP